MTKRNVKTSFRVLVVGAGSIGERHARCLLSVPGTGVGICEVSDGRRRHMQDRYSLEVAYDAFPPPDLDRFDAVVIATPAPLHIPMACTALGAGCHVLIEKPLTLDLAGLDELMRLAEKSGRIAAVAHVYRCMPHVEHARELLMAGRIGEPAAVTLVWGSDFARLRPAYRESYYVDPAQGGGAIFDAAIHMIDLVQWMLGPIVEVFCQADHLLVPDSRTEDVAVMTWRHASGVIGSLSLNQFQRDEVGRVEIVGPAGTLLLDQPTQTVRVLDTNGERHRRQFTHERDDFFVRQVERFLAACRGEGDVRCTLSEGAAAVAVCIAAHESARTGRLVRVPRKRWVVRTGGAG